jgi:hypothetical protein
MASVTLPLLTRPFARVWANEDAALGTRYDPFHGKRAKRAALVFKGWLLFVVYAASLVFYLFSWETIGPDGIEEHLPWATFNHSFQDIESLETIPDGERSDSIKQNGPWYSIKLKSGRFITISDENEGSTPDELAAMAALVADRSGLAWGRKSDARGL